MSNAAFQPRRILVIDDETFVCDAIRMMLEFDGHTVVTTDRGAKAVELLKPGGFDLVITDYSMPEMNGTELAGIIKETDPGLPVIMVTAYKELLPDPVPGVSSVITKPFLLENLRTAISKAVRPS